MKDKCFLKGNVTTNGFTLSYYITGYDEVSDITGYFEWGIEIRKSVNDKIIESEEIKNISPDYDKVSDLVDILMRNTVTPSGLVYALSDLLSQTVI